MDSTDALRNPHDKFFKEVMSRQDVARDFLLNYLPAEVVTTFDLGTLELRPDTYVDANLREHFSDLLYAVSLRDGGDAYVYILFEHKSFPDRTVSFQMLRYLVRIWERDWRQGHLLRPILPVVVYHGRARWEIRRDFHSLIEMPESLRSYVPDYRYWLCDLTGYSDEEIRGEVALRAAVLLLKHVMTGDVGEHLAEILRLALELKTGTGLEYLETILRYVAVAGRDVTEKEIRRVVEEVLEPEGGEIVATLAQKWIQEGWEKGLKEGLERGLKEGFKEGHREGREEGRTQGLNEGKRYGLLKAIQIGLEFKFGAEGLRVYSEIGRIQDVTTLEVISEGLRMASSPEDVRLLYRNVPVGGNGQESPTR